MRFAFVTDKLPRSGSAGHLALNFAMIEWLLQGGHEVRIFLTRPRFRWPVERYATAPVAGPGIFYWRGHVFAGSAQGAASIMAQNILSRLPARPMAALRRKSWTQSYGAVDTVIGAFTSPAQAAWCGVHIRAMAPDAILTDTIFRAPVLREPGMQQFNRVITAPDLFHRRHQAMRAAGYRPHPPQLPRELETDLLRTGDAIAAIQPEEAAEIVAMCPDQLVCITPMPALPCPPPADQVKLHRRLVFVGSDTLPNIDGLGWFFVEIWPRLRRLQPDVTLDLAGDCGAQFERLPLGVKRLGRVENLSGILHRSNLAIAPLRVSSGLKIKMLDYARHGLITVATTESLQGFALDANAPFIEAADAAGFVKGILTGLNARPTDQQHALAYVSRHYNAASSFAGLAKMLKIPPR